ncbi:MAG: protein translocase subunit SecD [Acidimicrobiales bacterium]|nr:protein translocase subunit SecD [Acidimicrobiales bacterium]
MRRKQIAPLLFIVVVAIAALTAVFTSGTTPQLGLDLQGGVSVVLRPTEDVTDDALDETIEIIRNRVDALGVAEPDIARQGDSVIVQLPGVENQQRALELVGDTAELRFRPVLQVLPGDIEDLLSSTTTNAPGETTTTVAGETTTSGAPVAGQSARSAATPFQDDPSATTVPADPGATTVPADPTATTVPATPPLTGFEVTPREEDLPDRPVVLLERDAEGEAVATYQLGPTMATGEVVSSATARIDQVGQWSVELVFKGGANGIDQFNAAAAACNAGTQGVCPTRQLAIVLDSEVVSAPTIEQPSFVRDEVQISGDFTEREAKNLALVLRYGSLPVELEPQTVQTVSATLGEDSLRAGLIAGLVGLALVCLYMLFYYRALGMVVVLGLAVWSALNYAIICWLGASQGLALSLSGVTGLVVSVGVTIDSYVVYFERLKDDVSQGRTLRTSTERAFKRAFRTIIAANVSSLIGAILLYWLTVGPVRGFAFFLGLATFLDIVVAYYFIRPMVGVLARSRTFTENRVFGVARGLQGKADGGAVSPIEQPKRSIWTRLYHGETKIDFVGRLRLWTAISAVVIVAGLVSFGIRGLNLGIDFEGGVVWEVPAGQLTVADAEEAMAEEGLRGVTVQTLEADDEVRIRVEAESVDSDKAADVTTRLADLTGADPDEVSLNSVGPSWGDEISEKALRALILFLIAITIYITLRFELRMALPTLVALVHDVIVTIGVYSLTGFEVTPATVVALLTILGFSIYDGIVVFDKVDENTQLVGSREGLSYSGMVNLSLNQVLMRSLNTSITALLPVASLLLLGSFVLGATTLEEFALALLIGLFAGAYSSIFIASPLLAILKEREPKYRAVRDKLAAKRPAAAPRVPAGVAAARSPIDPDAASTSPDAGPAAAPTGPPPTTPTTRTPGTTPSGDRVIPPRPRKKGRRR